MMNRQRKQALYLVLYVILFLFIIGTIVSAFLPDPTCSDGIQNQKEEGVDCGGPCTPCQERPDTQDIEILTTTLLPLASGRYDVVAEIRNPNSLYGLGSFSYSFTFFDTQGSILKKVSDRTYILPAQKRFIGEVEVEVEGLPDRVEFTAEEISWEEFSEYEAPSLTITNKSFERASSGTDFAFSRGLVRNASPYDFETVEVFVALKDNRGQIIAINKTDMQTVRAGERRDYVVTWKRPFQGEVVSVDAQAVTNMFKNQNFIKLFFPGGRFQDYQ